MTLTPAIKGQLTKAIKPHTLPNGAIADYTEDGTRSVLHTKVRSIFTKHMPREQAKHAARKFLVKLAA